MVPVRAGYFLLLSFGLMMVGGCRPQAATQSPDVEEISDLVYDLADLARDSDRFRQHFTSDAVPDDRARQEYRQSFFKLVEPPEVKGEEAMMRVLVTSDDHEAEAQWTAVKQGNRWKLSSAPLP